MKTIATLVAGLLLAAASLLGGAQDVAAPAPTISGPATTPYFHVANVTGTATPGEAVVLYVRRSGRPAFVDTNERDADSAGHYSIPLRMIRHTDYYVRSGSAQSATASTDLPAIDCSASGPYVTHLPLGPSRTATKDDPDFVAFTAARGETWAGVARRGAELAVVAKTGGSPVRILGRFAYSGHSYSPREHGSVTPVAVTPHGSVVADVQRTDTDLDADREQAFVWYGGVGHSLLAATDWKSFEATGVNDKGTIVGFARIGELLHDPVYRVVVWSEHGTRFHVLAATGTQTPAPVVDRIGDIAWTDGDGYPVARSAGGDYRELRVDPLSVSRDTSRFVGVTAASATAVFTGQKGMLRWPPSDGGTGPLVATRVGTPSSIYAIDPREDMLVSNTSVPTQLRTASGSLVRMPAQLHVAVPTFVVTAGDAFGLGGVIAYTAPDGLVHVMSCH